MNLWFDDSHTLNDPRRYRTLIEKLIYLTVTRSDITFVIRVLNRFTHHPREVHWTGALRIMAYVKSFSRKCLLHKKHEHVRIFRYFDSGYTGDKRDRKSTTGYCTFVGENLVTWRNKKQDVVSRSV